MIDAPEEVTDVELHDMGGTSDEPGTNPFHRLRRGPPRPEPERSISEIRLENGFQHQLGRLLHHPVADRGYPQRPPAAIWFRDLHTPGWRGAIPALPKVTGDLIEQPLDPVGLHLLQGQPVHTGRTPIGPDPFPRLPQHVTSVDTVEQSMETPPRRLLGRSP